MTWQPLLTTPHLALTLAGLLGAVVGYGLRRALAERTVRAAEVRARTIVHTAEA